MKLLLVLTLLVSLALLSSCASDERVAELEARLDALETGSSRHETAVRRHDGEIDEITAALDELHERPGTSSLTVDWYLTDNPEFAIERIAHQVALLSLLNNYGGYQTTSSPAAVACIDWYLLGTGSLTDCGWQRAE